MFLSIGFKCAIYNISFLIVFSDSNPQGSDNPVTSLPKTEPRWVWWLIWISF